MISKFVLAALAVGLAVSSPVQAQTEVTGGDPQVPVGVENPEALFTSSDPVLHRNKQAAYHIMKDLLEAGHWELADKYMTPRYIQHNMRARSGRDWLVNFMTKVYKQKQLPIPEKLNAKIISVVAEGDIVIVAYTHDFRDRQDPTKTNTVSWYDMWRFVDGKADEHWDSDSYMTTWADFK